MDGPVATVLAALHLFSWFGAGVLNLLSGPVRMGHQFGVVIGSGWLFFFALFYPLLFLVAAYAALLLDSDEDFALFLGTGVVLIGFSLMLATTYLYADRTGRNGPVMAILAVAISTLPLILMVRKDLAAAAIGISADVLPNSLGNSVNSSKYEQLAQLQVLRERGALSDEEFEAEKLRLLSEPPDN